MSEFPILSIITFLPLAGAALILLLRASSKDGETPQIVANARWTALWATTATFFLSLWVLFGFNSNDAGYQFVETACWLDNSGDCAASPLGIRYHMGVDGISVLFVMLTTFLTPFCIIASWKAITHRVTDYMIAFLILETLMIGTFCALDMVLFYFFFEGGLIPMFLIIGVWGGTRRVYSAFKFFLYTLLGSVLMLVALLWIYFQTGTTDIPTLQALQSGAPPDSIGLASTVAFFSAGAQKWLWLAFFASFAVKMPMWPVHTWLPDAHVEAPTAGSVILAAILLKMGGYGFLRFSLPIFPVASADFAPLIYALSIVAIIYTSLVALAQEDMKKLIAYSSVAHMGFVTMGIFTATQQGVEGALFQMLSHGLISGAMFLCVGVVYDRMHTREIAAYGGLVNRMPVYAFFFLLFTLGNVGLPGTSGFVGEFLTLQGAFLVDNRVAAFAATGVILSAGYALLLYRRVIFGELTKESLLSIGDLERREMLIFTPLALGVVWLGFFPAPTQDFFHAAALNLIDQYNAGLELAAGVR